MQSGKVPGLARHLSNGYLIILIYLGDGFLMFPNKDPKFFKANKCMFIWICFFFFYQNSIKQYIVFAKMQLVTCPPLSFLLPPAPPTHASLRKFKIHSSNGTENLSVQLHTQLSIWGIWLYFQGWFSLSCIFKWMATSIYSEYNSSNK
jgi:hypothetical protein